MSASRRLFRSRTAADLASVNHVLGRLDPTDYFGRVGLESRKSELEAELEQFAAPAGDTAATAALFFGGEPVIGSVGIESSFAGLAINKFQDLVAKLLIEDSGGLGQRGPLPSRPDATLHITGVLKGSFGFLLEELQPEGSLLDTPLKAAVAKATNILDAFSHENEQAFEDALEGTGARSLATAKDFFELLATNKATLRLVTGEREMEITNSAIERATDRALTSNIEEEEKAFEGTLGGLLPESHMFELHLADDATVVTGRVSKTIPTPKLTELLAALLNKRVSGRLKVRKVMREGLLVRQTYTLLELSQP